MHLKIGSYLQGGKYRIEKVLGKGGFGITYLAVQTNLKNRKVAIKEFFLKEHCERDSSTSHVSMGISGSRDLVYKFKAKFMKEAETISELENDHIIRINDVFEENGTAYYVMEYLSGGSLSDRIPSGGLPESEAVGYIRQIADALSYIHENKILHLDIKPSNILFRKEDEAVLIDFGISKHYDEEGGSQTSSTPVGVSRGYAPLEQYKKGGVAQFSPAPDVYSLGATLYKLLTGKTPPDADEVNEDGIPELPLSLSSSVRTSVQHAMSPKRKDRPQSVEAFLELLDAPVEQGGSGDETLPPPVPSHKSGNKLLTITIAAVLVGFLTLFLLFRGGVIDFPFDKGGDVTDSPVVVSADSVIVDEPVPVPAPASTDDKPSRAAEVEAVTISVPETDPLASLWENDLREYSSLMEVGDKYSKSDATLSQSKSKYEQALKFEMKYSGTKYSDKFSQGASKSLKSVESRIKEKEEADAAAAARAEADRLAKEQKAREESARKQKEEAERKREETSYTNGILRVKGVEYPMVYVSGGSFDMGATPEQGSDADDDEKPVHRVTLSSYSIGKYEVTQELWEAVMGSNPSAFQGSRRPVEEVSWDDCQDFIRKLNELTGANFRLPTEAEWEFAARGGNSSRGYKYSGSDTLDNVAWYYDNSDDNSVRTAHHVGMKSPNELGLYDMSGNVWEWCNDCYGSYSSSSQKDPKGSSSGSHRVFRGGSWSVNAWYSRVSHRFEYAPDHRYDDVGLRLCH